MHFTNCLTSYNIITFYKVKQNVKFKANNNLKLLAFSIFFSSEETNSPATLQYLLIKNFLKTVIQTKLCPKCPKMLRLQSYLIARKKIFQVSYSKVSPQREGSSFNTSFKVLMNKLFYLL